jgi:hypothetical protein
MIVVQLSHPHIIAPGELLYDRFDTAEFLARSVAEINRLDPLPDVAVVTGDLVDHGDPTEYELSARCSHHLRCRSSSFPAITTLASRCAPRSPETVICRLTGFSSLRLGSGFPRRGPLPRRSCTNSGPVSPRREC